MLGFGVLLFSVQLFTADVINAGCVKSVIQSNSYGDFDGYYGPNMFHGKNVFTNNQDYRTRTLLTKTSNYWLSYLGYTGARTQLILSLGCSLQIKGFWIKNTHNSGYQNAGTKAFSIFISEKPEGPWEKVLNASLKDARNVSHVPIETFSLPNTVSAKYLMFQVDSYYGAHGGLQYLSPYGNNVENEAFLCHHWTAEQTAIIHSNYSQFIMEQVCKDAGPEYVYTQGNEEQAPGCGDCWCCKRLVWKPILDCFTGLAITTLREDQGSILSTKPVTGKDNQMWAFDSDGRIVNKATSLVIDGSSKQAASCTMQEQTPLTETKQWHLRTDIRSGQETAAKTVPKLINGDDYCLQTRNRFASQGSEIMMFKCTLVNPDNACWKF